MPELFELTELASYLQQDLDASSATLARELTTTGIRLVVGPARWAALTTGQATDLKGLALDIARRLYLNAEMRRSERIDDYEYTNATETLGDTELDEDEKDRVRRIFGMRTSGGAYTITPASPRPRHACSPAYRRPIY
ncbi:hypothetical protein ABZS66_19205 [Dactylosporangium sp. NPDC005572]|uniref:hypothetical protein n=1 Tax=Dactylosporangium sp. NPDC005572 TaxID=3156889 RepID=UPI0033B3268C